LVASRTSAQGIVIHQSIGSYGPPVLNDKSQAAFWRATQPNGGGPQFILIGDGSSTDEIARGAIPLDPNAYPELGRALSVNENGEVAFWAGLGHSGQSIVRGTPSNHVVIATSGAQFQSFGLTGQGRFVSVNNNSEVAFEGIEAGTLAAGVYVGDGSAVSTVVDGNQWGTLNGTPAIDDNSNVAFWSHLGNPGIFQRSVFGGGFAKWADPSDGLVQFSAWNLSLNAKEGVAFVAQRPDRSWALYTAYMGGSPVYVSGEPFYSGIDAVSYNDVSGLAFYANGPSGTGIYVRPPGGSIVPFVILNQWYHHEGVVEWLEFSREGLNNLHQIAFAVKFWNGPARVYVDQAYVYVPPAGSGP